MSKQKIPAILQKPGKIPAADKKAIQQSLSNLGKKPAVVKPAPKGKKG